MPKPKLTKQDKIEVILHDETPLMEGMEILNVQTGAVFIVHCIAGWLAEPGEACVVLRARGDIDRLGFLHALHARDLQDADSWVPLGF